jgi:hypothetical protein
MSLAKDWNSGGGAQVVGHEKPALRDLLHAATGLTEAEALAMLPGERHDGMIVQLDDGSLWRWNEASTLAAATGLIKTPDDAPTAGRFLRFPGAALITLPITFATADAAALLTVPTGCWLNLRELFWTVSASFTGGSSSAIGVSSNKTNYTTKGDLLGGATGDVLATLAASANPIMGTIGAGFDTLAKRRAIWFPGNTIRFDRITSAFTAGVGAVNLIVDVLKNDGA